MSIERRETRWERHFSAAALRAILWGFLLAFGLKEERLLRCLCVRVKKRQNFVTMERGWWWYSNLGKSFVGHEAGALRINRPSERERGGGGCLVSNPLTSFYASMNRVDKRDSIRSMMCDEEEFIWAAGIKRGSKDWKLWMGEGSLVCAMFMRCNTSRWDEFDGSRALFGIFVSFSFSRVFASPRSCVNFRVSKGFWLGIWCTMKLIGDDEIF